jgi:NAD(P)-dependent dehydrogenase (short-subunit alcohol dehydrogenase family)
MKEQLLNIGFKRYKKENKMDRVKGKVAIVTGAARGLGKAEAVLLAKEGAKVVATDINETLGKKVPDEVRREGGEAIFIKHDVNNEQNWKEVIQKTISEFGKLDILVNNAGVLYHHTIEDISLEKWRWILGINLEGVFLGTKHAIGAMKKSGGGSIVNISSIAGLVGMPDTSSYVASKGAVRLFTKSAALECSKMKLNYNIRVNSIHPGFIWTEMVDAVIKTDVEKTGKTFEEVKKMYEDLTMMGHFGKPEDIAYGVLYFASDESKYITGAELTIDGGYTAK